MFWNYYYFIFFRSAFLRKIILIFNFHGIGPLGRFGLVVAMSVCIRGGYTEKVGCICWYSLEMAYIKQLCKNKLFVFPKICPPIGEIVEKLCNFDEWADFVYQCSCIGKRLPLQPEYKACFKYKWTSESQGWCDFQTKFAHVEIIMLWKTGQTYKTSEKRYFRLRPMWLLFFLTVTF